MLSSFVCVVLLLSLSSAQQDPSLSLSLAGAGESADTLEILPPIFHRPFDPNRDALPSSSESNVISDDSSREASTSSSCTGTDCNPIVYHGGPIIPGPTRVFLIWYGSAFASTTKEIIHNFLNGLSGSNWMNIQTTYSSYTASCSNSITFNAQTDSVTTGYLGWFLLYYDIRSIVENAITDGLLPGVQDAIYFVITDPTVIVTTNGYSFCSSYCGWHTISDSDNFQNVKYGHIGDPTNCGSCGVRSVSPNNNPGADAMVSVLAHEITATVTNPYNNAWYSGSSNGNADKCVWNYGTTYSTSNGALANLKLGSTNYLVQTNWDASLQTCVNGRTSSVSVPALWTSLTGSQSESLSSPNYLNFFGAIKVNSVILGYYAGFSPSVYNRFSFSGGERCSTSSSQYHRGTVDLRCATSSYVSNTFDSSCYHTIYAASPNYCRTPAPSIAPTSKPTLTPTKRPTRTPTLTPTRTIFRASTVVGSTQGTADGFGTSALLTSPDGFAMSPDGSYALIGSSKGGGFDNRIRKITSSTLEVTTFAGQLLAGYVDDYRTNAYFNVPRAVVISRSGMYAYVADSGNKRVRTIRMSTGRVTTLAGNGATCSSSCVDDVGTSSSFRSVDNLAISSDGSFLLVVDNLSHNIRKVLFGDYSVIVSTLVGSISGAYGSVNGIGTNALFSFPHGIALASDSSFFLVSGKAINNYASIRKVTMSTLQVETIGGQGMGYSDGFGTNAKFMQAYDIRLGPNNRVAVISDIAAHTIRKLILRTGEVSTLMGRPSTIGGYVDGIGTNVLFYSPTSLDYAPDGSALFVVDRGNNVIRRIALA